jgi:hypothetical protein
MRITMIMGNTPKVDTEWTRPLLPESAGQPEVAEHVHEPGFPGRVRPTSRAGCAA